MVVTLINRNFFIMNNQSPPFDLLITADRIYCSETAIDGKGAIAIHGDRIAAVGADLAGPAIRSVHFGDALLIPGLVDMHAHPARGSSRYGVDPDEHFLPRGVTTCLSQGDAGALNWPAYRDEVIDGCQTRVRLALHLSKYGESQEGHCFEQLDNADVDLCVEAATSAGEEIWGIAFNTMRNPAITIDPRQIMRRGMDAPTAGRSPPASTWSRSTSRATPPTSGCDGCSPWPTDFAYEPYSMPLSPPARSGTGNGEAVCEP